MSRTRSKIIQSLAPVLVLGAIVAPSAGATERTATELGQSTDPSASIALSSESSQRTATELGQSTGSPPAATPSAESAERTATELAQAVGEPGDRNGAFAGTATEFGQSTDLSPSLAPPGESGGFNWGDAAIVAGGGLALLIGVGGIVLFSRRRGAVRKPRTPVVSS
jgi:hypothetical protein